jgi:hypothetical protein
MNDIDNEPLPAKEDWVPTEDYLEGLIKDHWKILNETPDWDEIFSAIPINSLEELD